MVNFKIVLEKDEGGWIVATCPSLPGCVSQGKTEKQVLKNMQEAIELHLKSLAEDGLPLHPKKNGKKEVVLSVTV
jgi:predicted RNase H-like HicB family nuclease